MHHHIPPPLPPVILWSPLEQFRTILPDVRYPKCITLRDNSVSLCTTGWRNGAEGERSEPRRIDGVTLLVGRIYKCSKGHEVLGYSPEILEKVPNCLSAVVHYWLYKKFK